MPVRVRSHFQCEFSRLTLCVVFTFPQSRVGDKVAFRTQWLSEVLRGVGGCPGMHSGATWASAH